MKSLKSKLALAAAPALALAAAGCATVPYGPTIAVMPGPDVPYDVFEQDDWECRDRAWAQVEPEAQRANEQAVGAAVLTTALGAAIGGAVDGGRGAGIGAASGAAAGAGIGASTSSEANYGLQRRYDVVYAQCMYAKGHQVPGYY